MLRRAGQRTDRLGDGTTLSLCISPHTATAVIMIAPHLDNQLQILDLEGVINIHQLGSTRIF
jgi:hypothetical protein